MGSEWAHVTLGDLASVGRAEIKTGPFGTKLKADEYTSHGAPLISVREIQLGRVVVGPHTPCVPAAVQERMPEYLLRAGDIVFARKGGIERSALIPREQDGFFMGSDALRVRLDESICCAQFVSYVVRSRQTQAWLVQHSTGSTMPSLSGRILALLPLTLPPLAEQRRIAAVLGALDDKIELNRKMNQTLEEMAQALFKSWFIDFDGHDPADLVDSELGPIPRGWSWIPFSKAGRWVSGGTPSKENSDYWSGEIPWFSAKSLGSIWLSDSPLRVTALGADNGTRRVPEKTVLFVVRGMSLAKEWRIGMTTRDATLNQDLKGIIDDGTVVPELLLLWLLVNRELIRHTADEAGHGTKRLPTAVLHKHALCLPPRGEQERQVQPLRDLLENIRAQTAASTTLADLRDALLPKLISGEIRVPEAEAAVGAAL